MVRVQDRERLGLRRSQGRPATHPPMPHAVPEPAAGREEIQHTVGAADSQVNSFLRSVCTVTYTRRTVVCISQKSSLREYLSEISHLALDVYFKAYGTRMFRNNMGLEVNKIIIAIILIFAY